MAATRAFTRPELATILDRASDSRRDTALVHFLYRTGYRVSEAMSLNLRDVLNADGLPLSHVTVRAENMKGGKRARTVPLHPDAAHAIARYAAERQARAQRWGHVGEIPEDAPLFLDQRGGRMSRHGFRPLLNRLTIGMEGTIGAHSFRKTFAAHLHEHFDGDLSKLQQAIGHERITSTMYYLPSQKEAIDKAILTFK
jgi:integrase/recombinase XerD